MKCSHSGYREYYSCWWGYFYKCSDCGATVRITKAEYEAATGKNG